MSEKKLEKKFIDKLCRNTSDSVTSVFLHILVFKVLEVCENGDFLK